MHHFVNAYWERGGKRGHELTLFLSYLAPRWSPTDDNPLGTGDLPLGIEEALQRFQQRNSVAPGRFDRRSPSEGSSGSLLGPVSGLP